MARDDWFRKQTWSAHDAEEFQQRLQRSRGRFHKAQYLRIQAGHLAEVGLHSPALSLLSQLLRDFPEPSELASTHLQRAQIHLAQNDHERAIECFREALVAEDAYPNVRTGAPLEFAWFIIARERVELYGEVESLLLRHEGKHGVTFPVERYQCAAARAIVAHGEGRFTDARGFVSEARRAASEQHSGFQYHPNIGLVGTLGNAIERRLAAIGGV